MNKSNKNWIIAIIMVVLFLGIGGLYVFFNNSSQHTSPGISFVNKKDNGLQNIDTLYYIEQIKRDSVVLAKEFIIIKNNMEKIDELIIIVKEDSVEIRRLKGQVKKLKKELEEDDEYLTFLRTQFEKALEIIHETQDTTRTDVPVIFTKNEYYYYKK